MDKNGVRVENKVVTKKGKTYYFGADGKALTGMRKVGRKYYYFSTTSFAMEKNYKYVAANGSIYYFGSKGYRAKNKFYHPHREWQEEYLLFWKNGKAYKGWYTIKGKKYYFYRGTGAGAGVRAQNLSLTSADGLVSVFNKNGVCTKQYR